MMRQSWLIAAAAVLSAALIDPADSEAQRQRWPGGNGGGRQQEAGGSGGRQRESGGGGARQRDSGGSRLRDAGGARQQAGGGRAEVRSAQPRGDRGDGADRGRRESPPPVVRESPPPQARPTPPPEARAEAGSQDGRQARRRFPTEADRGNVTRGNVTRGNVARNGGDRGNVIRDRGDRGGVVRDNSRVRNGSRVAVPRVGPPPDRRDYPRGYNAYRNYGGRNIYIVPRGRTYIYYPRYYYHPYSFGYGPAGRGHFYFDLYYSSYIWHPYSVYRYGTYGTYGYPIGELRLKVHPRDAQVFIDGYYAGRVDDFDGIFQSLKLEEGEYQVEIVLPGYEPLAFDVRIFPGEKTTYEGDLIPELP
jgi:hypothetical protein